MQAARKEVEQLDYTVKISDKDEKYVLEMQGEDCDRMIETSLLCVFHWLDCLYQDYLDEKIAEEMPCNSCPEVMNCKTSPLEPFALVSQMFGIKMKSIKPRNLKG